MPKIRCKQRDCKYNNKEYCIKEGIYVRDDAVCESYRKGHLDRSYAFEFATFEDDEKGIKCDATTCYHNDNCKCKANSICVQCNNAYCIDYNPKEKD